LPYEENKKKGENSKNGKTRSGTAVIKGGKCQDDHTQAGKRWNLQMGFARGWAKKIRELGLVESQE